MRLLIVVHNFLPNHAAGGELYTYHVSKELAKQHEVLIFCTDHAVFRRNYSRRTYDFDGLPVVEVTNHRAYGEFTDSYADKAMESHFRRLLQEYEPDLIHFQHVLHHSVGYAEIARELGVPSVMTLHEYWLLCARNGQMIQADETLCSRPALDKCSRCMEGFMWGRKSVDVWVLRGIAALKSVTGVDLRAKAREIRLSQKNRPPADDPHNAIEAMKKLLLVREARMRDLFAYVDAFIAPSRFLKARFEEFGYEGERIIYSDYGTSVDAFTRTELRQNGPLRIGYLSSFQPAKGAHVLVDALSRLDHRTYTATLYGDVRAKPEYVREIEASKSPSTEVRPPAPYTKIPQVLASMDVLVVPSIWWENSPLVIHEAFAAGVPVVCSGIGGMAELVEDGVSGLHFRTGDGADLASKLRALIENRSYLASLQRGIPELKSIKDDADFLEELFDAILQSYG